MASLLVDDEDLHQPIHDVINCLLTAHARIGIDELLNSVGEKNCTQQANDEDRIDRALKFESENYTRNDEEFILFPVYEEQLVAAALCNGICNQIDIPTVTFKELGKLHRKLRLDRCKISKPLKVDQYFT